jgi:hypothetical protein
MNKLYLAILIAFFSACSNSKQSTSIEDYELNKDSLMMQIVPFIANLHDSISNQNRFLDQNRSYMESHIIERQYQWMNFYTDKDSWNYFQVSRLEPSIKNDKFAAICGRFKFKSTNSIDSSSFSEIYWTWKMKEEQLKVKSSKLFEIVINKQSILPYQYPQANEDWIEFPSDKVYYDQNSKTWKVK